MESPQYKMLMTKIAANDGFLSVEHLELLAQLDPHKMLLVRCGNGRFTCPAQDVKHFVDIITREDSDYVRDVSLLATYEG